MNKRGVDGRTEIRLRGKDRVDGNSEDVVDREQGRSGGGGS